MCKTGLFQHRHNALEIALVIQVFKVEELKHLCVYVLLTRSPAPLSVSFPAATLII